MKGVKDLRAFDAHTETCGTCAHAATDIGLAARLDFCVIGDALLTEEDRRAHDHLRPRGRVEKG